MEKKLIDLPKSVLCYLLSFLDLPHLFNFSLICKKGSALFKEESLWRFLCLRDHDEERGEESWQEKYKNSLFKWLPAPDKNIVSDYGRTVTSIKSETMISKMNKPLTKDKIHKCLLFLHLLPIHRNPKKKS